MSIERFLADDVPLEEVLRALAYIGGDQFTFTDPGEGKNGFVINRTCFGETRAAAAKALLAKHLDWMKSPKPSDRWDQPLEVLRKRRAEAERTLPEPSTLDDALSLVDPLLKERYGAEVFIQIGRPLRDCLTVQPAKDKKRGMRPPAGWHRVIADDAWHLVAFDDFLVDGYDTEEEAKAVIESATCICEVWARDRRLVNVGATRLDAVLALYADLKLCLQEERETLDVLILRMEMQLEGDLEKPLPAHPMFR